MSSINRFGRTNLLTNISPRTIAALATTAALLLALAAIIPAAFADSVHIKVSAKNNCHQNDPGDDVADANTQTCTNVADAFA